MRDTRTLGIGREALYTLLSKVVLMLVGFAGTVVFAWTLGSSGLGVYKTATAAAFVFTQISGGVGTAVKKRVSEFDVDPSEFLGAGLLIHLAFSAFVIIGLLVALKPASDYFGSPALTLGVGAVVATLGLFNVVNRTFAGVGYPARSTWMDTIRSVLTLGCQLGLLLAGLEAFGLVLGLALGTLGGAVLSWAAAGVRPGIPSKRTVGRVYDFARWSVPNGLLTNLYSSADILIITALVGTAATGLYAVASQLVMPAAFLASSITGAMFVRASGRYSADEEVVTDLMNSVAYAGLFAIPMLFGALAMPQAIPRTVFSAEFAAAGGALIGMAMFQIGNVFSSPFESIFGSIDRPDVVFRVNVLITVLHLPLAIGLGFEFGLLGVVGATVGAEAVRLVVYQFLAFREFNRVVLPRPVLEQFASGLVMFALLETVLTEIGIGSWLVLLAMVGTGATVYFGVLFAISAHFRLSLRHALPVEFGPFETP